MCKHRQSPPAKPVQGTRVSFDGVGQESTLPSTPTGWPHTPEGKAAVLVRPLQMMSGRSCDSQLASADQLHVLLRSRRRIGLRSCCRGLALSRG